MLTEKDLNDLVPDLNLSKKEAELFKIKGLESSLHVTKMCFFVVHAMMDVVNTFSKNVD